MKRQGFGFAGLRRFAQGNQKTGKFEGMKKMQDKGQATKRRLARPQRRAKPAVEPVVKFEERSQNMKNEKYQIVLLNVI